MSNDKVTDEVKTIVHKVMMDIATRADYLAPSGPASASQTPVQPPAEPILFEKDGWGIYTRTSTEGELVREGEVLTHIGCDCDFAHWSFSHIVTRGGGDITMDFRCLECEEPLRLETYKTLVQVYRFINGLTDKSGGWNV